MVSRHRGEGVRVALGALLALAASCATPAPAPTAPPPSTSSRPPPPPADPCAGDCLADIERLAANSGAQARARIQLCLRCPGAPVQAYARAADVSAGDGALDVLRMGTERHPHAALLWHLRGRAALASGRTDEGIAALVRAVRLQPDDPGVQAELQLARRRQAATTPALVTPLARAQSALAKKDFAGARRALDAAAEQSRRPEDEALVLHRRALVSIAAEAPAQALEETQAGLRRAPAHARALRAELLVTLADLHIAAGRADDALFAAAAAAELAPSDPLAHANLAVARALGDDVDGALAALRAAIDAGLPTRLKREELLGIAAFAPLEDRPDFRRLVDQGWR